MRMIRCELCGKEFENTQGLRGYKTFSKLLMATIYQTGFPISTLSEVTSNIFVLETDDIPNSSDCQT